eukprot:6696481-Pyramimonas_sp.AAC.1
MRRGEVRRRKRRRNTKKRKRRRRRRRRRTIARLRKRVRLRSGRLERLGCLGGNRVNWDRSIEDNGSRLRGPWVSPRLMKSWT